MVFMFYLVPILFITYETNFVVLVFSMRVRISVSSYTDSDVSVIDKSNKTFVFFPGNVFT